LDLRVNVFKSFVSWVNNPDYDINNKKYLYLAKKLLFEARTRKILSNFSENTKRVLKEINLKNYNIR
jgi:hypothetical protein